MDNFPPSNPAASALPHGFAPYSVPDFSFPMPPDMPVWPPASRRFLLSPAEWNALRPVIQQWYIDEGKKFKEVKLLLETHHNFSPTKSQFGDKVKKWGLKKNANRSDRALLLSGLSGAGVADGVQQTTLKLNAKKVERWRREERLTEIGKPLHGRAAEGASIAAKIDSHSGITPLDDDKEVKNATSLHQNQASLSASRASPTSEMPPERALSPLRETLRLASEFPELDMESKTIWDLANIPGSPTLKGFLLACEIDKQCSLLESLHSGNDQESNNLSENCIEEIADGSPNTRAESANLQIQSSSHAKRQQQRGFLEAYSYKWLLDEIERPWSPLNEVYPFPISRKAGPTSSIVINSVGKALRVEMVEIEGRLSNMEKLFLKDSPEAVAEMDRLAYIYQMLGKYGQAETLYYRVAAANQKTFGDDSRRTLQSHLNIVNIYTNQGKYKKAATHHQAFHQRVVDLFGSWDDLACQSMAFLAEIKNFLDKKDEAEALRRDLLQIALSKFGLKHHLTCRYLQDLGATLLSKNNHAQVERILVVALQIQNQLQGNERMECQLKGNLGRILSRQQKFKEGNSLLKDAVRQSYFSFGTVDLETSYSIQCMAGCLRRQGDFLESELLIRQVVWPQERLVGPTHPYTMESLTELVNVLMDLERWEEAATRCEELLRAEIESSGPEHQSSLRIRSTIEYCYDMQGLYGDPSSRSVRINTVLSQKAGTRIATEKYARKYDQTKEREEEDDEEEVEEIQPLKRRRVMMTCTLNLKSQQR